jgi:hypothetical protein
VRKTLSTLGNGIPLYGQRLTRAFSDSAMPVVFIKFQVRSSKFEVQAAFSAAWSTVPVTAPTARVAAVAPGDA